MQAIHIARKVEVGQQKFGLDVIVEDDGLIAMDLAELLIGLGHEICTIARTEDEAVQAAYRFQPDLLIVDAHIDEGSGISAMQRILAQGFVAHIFVTGDPAQVREAARDAIIVPKPYRISDLLNGIERARQAGVSRAPT